MNTPEIQHDITVLKNFLLNANGTYQTKKIVYKWIAKRCPYLIAYFNSHYKAEDFRGFIYCLLHDSTKVPVIPCCPICGKKLQLYDFVKGFHKTCSRICADKLYSKNKEAHQRISETKKDQKLKADWLYAYDFESISNNTIFKNYCKHGDVKISDSVMYNVHEIDESSFCYECNKEMFETYMPDDKAILDTVNWFQDFYKLNSHSLNYKFWIRYYPKKFKCLVKHFEFVTGKVFDETMLPELHYVCQSGINELPKCSICGNPVTKFHAPVSVYATRCDEHLKSINNMSLMEKEVYEYITKICPEYTVVSNERTVLGKQEIDIYIPELKIGFEFNGVYWHSDKFLPHMYHQKKKALAESKGVKLYFIWSDDWIYKTDIIKNIIRAKLHLNNQTIKSDDSLSITVVDKETASNFFNGYHINGYCNATFHLGLYVNNVLTYCMSFKKDSVKYYEIIQYACIFNYDMQPGIRLLYNYFVRKYIKYNQKVSCKIHADYSCGTLLKLLGFDKLGVYEDCYAVVNNKRHKEQNSSSTNTMHCYTSGLIYFVNQFPI